MEEGAGREGGSRGSGHNVYKQLIHIVVQQKQTALQRNYTRVKKEKQWVPDVTSDPGQEGMIATVFRVCWLLVKEGVEEAEIHDGF